MSTHIEGSTIGDIKILRIPDYVLPTDIPGIYEYFDYFNIADVKNVKFHEFSEEEYYVEDNSPYGYAIIEIENWHDTQSTRNFYQSILENRCKMVYDDPDYWDLEFYESNNKHLVGESSKNVEINIEKPEEVYCDKNEEMIKQEDESSEFDSENDVDSDPQFESANEEHEDEEHEDEEHEDEAEEEFDSGSEQDDLRDLDYDYEEPDETLDKKYEYYQIANKLAYQIETRSKTRAKLEKTKNKDKNKNKNSKDDVTLKDLLVKNRKRANKDNRKNFVWSRRLRQKIL